MSFLAESRYDRQERISWWRQDRLRAASILVVGAGALGNEIVKNLALLGVGAVTVIDMDHIEHSNLARCVLFRDHDVGAAKAEVVARRAAELNPETTVTGIVGPVQGYGVAAVALHDLVIAGLDSREARLWVNQACRKMGRTWVDGAIEGLDGHVRVFPPSGACYECTMSDADRELIAARRSCALLTVDQIATGKVPTNVTMAAVIGGLQAQAAIKLLHADDGVRTVLNGGLRYLGDNDEAFRVMHDEDEYCGAHDRYVSLESIGPGSTLREALGGALEGAVAVDLEDGVVTACRCHECGRTSEPIRFMRTLGPEDAYCECGTAWTMEAQVALEPSSPILDLPMDRFGFASYDVVTVRGTDGRRHFVVEGARA